MAAIATGDFFGVDEKTINSSIESYISTNNRSQQITTDRNRIILDAYNANPFSMKEALASFFESKFDNPWILLGDMFELGEFSKEEHRSIVDQIKTYGFTNVILIGKDFCQVDNHDYLTFSNTKEALLFLTDRRIENADILIKGSRGMKMETLLEVL